MYCFLAGLAPGAVGIGSQTHAVEVCGECCVTEAKAREGHIQHAGLLSYGLTQGCGDESVRYCPMVVMRRVLLRELFQFDRQMREMCKMKLLQAYMI